MKDYISELKEMKRISDISQAIIMLTYTPHYVSLMMEETDKICNSKRNKDKFMRYIDKCFKMFANDDFEYMLPVLTTATLNMLTRTTKILIDNHEQKNDPTKMFG